MVLDFSEPDNKKYIPIATFALGVFVGGLCMHFWMQKKSKETALFNNGGAVATPQAAQPQPIVIQTSSAPPAMAAPMAQPVMGNGNFNSNTPI